MTQQNKGDHALKVVYRNKWAGTLIETDESIKLVIPVFQFILAEDERCGIIHVRAVRRDRRSVSVQSEAPLYPHARRMAIKLDTSA